MMLFRNKLCGASFLVGQGRGCNTMLSGLDVNPGMRYLDAAPPPPHTHTQVQNGALGGSWPGIGCRVGIRSSGRSPLNYEPAISAGFGGSEPQTEAPKVKSNRAR